MRTHLLPIIAFIGLVISQAGIILISYEVMPIGAAVALFGALTVVVAVALAIFKGES